MDRQTERERTALFIYVLGVRSQSEGMIEILSICGFSTKDLMHVHEERQDVRDVDLFVQVLEELYVKGYETDWCFLVSYLFPLEFE